MFEGLGITKDKTIIIDCAGGFTSGNVIQVLCALGYTSMRNYVNGRSEWSSQELAFYPVVTPKLVQTVTHSPGRAKGLRPCPG